MRRNIVGWLALAALVALPALLEAQERTVTGQVTAAETRQPLNAVRVTVKGTLISTVTDREGRFTLQVPANATALEFAYIGFKKAEAAVQSEMQIALERQAVILEGVVVTALGIEREKRSLGYAAQAMQGGDLVQVPKLNVVNSLQGQVAGVQITDAGPTGGTARIVIRGSSSITANNQPLFIVDGIPIDNSAAGAGYNRNQGFGGIDRGNAAQDIDPNNIESVTVLKGPNAAALYGSRAQNGAIVITTKSGRVGELGVSITSSFTTEQPLRLPNYQNLYGQGFDGQFRWVNGAGSGTYDFADESWGPKLDGRLIDQFTGPQQPWVPHPDNVRNFFRTGTTFNTNMAISRATPTSNVRLSVTSTQVEGMAPGNTIGRLGLTLKGGAAINDRLSTEASLNYVSQDAENRPGTGYDTDNPLQSFIWFGRGHDMEALRHYRCDGSEPTPCRLGGQYNWNYNYHNNPFWEQLVNGNGDQRDRLLGHAQVSYQLNDWITATGRVGRDWYRDHRKDVVEFNSLEDGTYTAPGDGGFNEETIYRAETNADLLVSARRQLTPDLTLDVAGGGNVRENKYQQAGVNVDHLIAPSIFTLDNASGPSAPYDDLQRKRVRSLYGSLTFNYKGYLNVDVTGRNDWSSTLPKGNNSYFYPSVSTAFVFTDALNIRNRYLSSGKLRASWTQVGNDTDPYQLTSVLTSQAPWGSTAMFSIPNAMPNLNLKPEQTNAWEVGADLGFFNERVGFVLTRYDRTTKDQIIPVQISATGGYLSRLLNAGKVRNAGWELLLQGSPVRQPDGLHWDVSLNWGKNTSQVRELYGDLQTLVLGNYWGLDIEARGPENGKYYPYGTMFGNGYLRDAQGRWLLDDDGFPQTDPVRRVLGQYSPDWNGGIQNRFSYGSFAMSVLFDGQMGGNIFSTTKWWGEYAGVLASTLRGRENDFYFDSTVVDPGPPIEYRGKVCDPGFAVPGILPDGSVNGDGVNDVRVCPDDYFHGQYGNHEAGIVDASYLKLRELRLSYQLPASVASRFGFSGGEVALIGRNLFLWSKYDNIDPETAFDASNVQGIEFGQFPTARSLGFSITFRR
jgi:TonB-linked SusC/RagA family outer membrane protein